MEDRRKLLAHAGAVAAPLVVLMCARILLTPPVPVGASESHAVAPQAPIASPSKPPTSEQQTAAQWVSKVDLEAPFYSPLRPRRQPQPVVFEPEPFEDPGPVSPANPTQGLRLTSVVGRGSQTVACINGQIYRIDEEVRPGLMVVGIDLDKKLVELRGPDGTVYVLTPAR